MMQNDNIIRYIQELGKSLAISLKRRELEELILLKEDIDDEELLDEEINKIEVHFQNFAVKLGKIEILINSNNIPAMLQIKSVHEFSKTTDDSQNRKEDSITTLIALAAQQRIKIESLTVEQAYLLCNAMMMVPFENFGIYDRVLSSPCILDQAKGKSPVLFDQLDVLEGVLEYCDSNMTDEMSIDQYERAISDSLNIITSYEIENELSDKIL